MNNVCQNILYYSLVHIPLWCTAIIALVRFHAILTHHGPWTMWNRLYKNMKKPWTLNYMCIQHTKWQISCKRMLKVVLERLKEEDVTNRHQRISFSDVCERRQLIASARSVKYFMIRALLIVTPEGFWRAGTLSAAELRAAAHRIVIFWAFGMSFFIWHSTRPQIMSPIASGLKGRGQSWNPISLLAHR